MRIFHAHFETPRFAGTLPRIRYVRQYRGPGEAPASPAQLPRTRAEQRDLLRYQRALGSDPRIPLIVPVAKRSRRGNITFLLPTRYNALTTEAIQARLAQTQESAG